MKVIISRTVPRGDRHNVRSIDYQILGEVYTKMATKGDDFNLLTSGR
jgi:hypothetical protein